MSIDRASRNYEEETARRYDEQVAADIHRTQAARIDPDGPRPHGEHPTLGLCDCDDCQLWDQMQRTDQ